MQEQEPEWASMIHTLPDDFAERLRHASSAIDQAADLRFTSDPHTREWVTRYTNGLLRTIIEWYNEKSLGISKLV